MRGLMALMRRLRRLAGRGTTPISPARRAALEYRARDMRLPTREQPGGLMLLRRSGQLFFGIAEPGGHALMVEIGPIEAIFLADTLRHEGEALHQQISDTTLTDLIERVSSE